MREIGSQSSTLNFAAEAWRGHANASRTMLRQTYDPLLKEALKQLVECCERLAALAERKRKSGYGID